MKKERIASLGTTTESITKLATAAIKFSICLGSTCVIFYALRVGHFPQGLALGDGLLFVAAAACFGFVYSIFAMSMLALGMCFSIVLRPLFYGGVRLASRLKGTEIKVRYDLASFSGSSVIPAALGVLFILLLGRRAPDAYLHLPLLAVAMYLFYSAARAAGAAYRRQQRTVEGELPTETTAPECTQDTTQHKLAFFVTATTVFFLPLLLGGVTGQLAEGSMRLAQVRVEKAVVYIKAPYAALLPRALAMPDNRSPEGYEAFHDVTILFQGFGSTTTIGFKDAGRSRQFDLPNDDLIIERESN